MASCTLALGLYLQKDRILVTIDPQLDDVLNLSRGFALAPQFLTRAAPIVGFTRGDGEPESFIIHISEHQHFAGSEVLSNNRYEARAIVTRI